MSAPEGTTPAGMTVIESAHGPTETVDRLAAAVRARGMTVMARIDHAGAAAKAGLTLRPTELLIFGAARGGTPMMQAAQTAGIDLPLKALVWQDEAGKTWLGYNDPAWIAARHGAAVPIDGLAIALATVAEEATAAAA